MESDNCLDERPGGANWHSFVEEPLVIDDESQQIWTHSADWLVVGFGGAGATAALRASRVASQLISKTAASVP